MLRWSPCVPGKFGEVIGSTHSWESSVSSAPPLYPQKNCMRKGAKLSITGPRIIQFRSNFVQSSNIGHPKCCKSSRSRGQRSRSQRNITCAKISKIINNSAGDCSISLKFRTHFDHVTFDVPRTFKVNGSKVKVTAWHNVSASNKLYNSGTNKLLKVKLGENYPRAECNT